MNDNMFCDSVIINGLKVNTIIGVYDWERVIYQPIIIDVQIDCHINKALFEDDLVHTLNYKQICEDIESICYKTQAKLLEYLAGRIFDHLFNYYPCSQIKLSLKKPNAIFNATDVGVTLVRKRQDFIHD